MGFLDRLARGPQVPVEETVARNLTAVLNAKKGYAEAAEVFGLGDHERYPGGKALLEALVREMLAAVKAFEPRAGKPEISFLGREGTLFAAFRLRCEIEGRPAAFRIRMQTVLRYFTVEPMAAGLPDEGAAR